MTTEQATKKLATIWELGGFCPVAMEIEAVKAASRNWDWPRANRHMDAAYAALGSTAPEVDINAIHNGKHPVQQWEVA